MADHEHTVNLSRLQPENVFAVEELSPSDAAGVIEEQNYYFVIKERRRGGAFIVSAETKKNISSILTQKSKEAIAANNAELAQNLLNSALRYDETNVAAFNLYGRILRAAGYPNDAVGMYARCLAVDPSNVEALISRANIFYRQQKKIYEAEWHLKLAYKFHPTNIVVLTTYAGFFADCRKDIEIADKFYNKALTQMNKKALHLSITSRNDLLKKPGKNRRSAGEEKQSEADEPEPILYPDLLYNYALFLAEHKREWMQAQQFLNRFLKCRPRDQEAQKLLKEISTKLGNKPGK